MRKIGPNVEDLSAEAQELIRLTSKDSWHSRIDATVDISTILKDRPDLLSGLNEYMKWRDEVSRAEDEETTTAPIEHGVLKATRELVKEDILLEKINAAMAALGTKVRWRVAPQRMEGIGSELLQELNIVIIDDSVLILEAVVPFLITYFASVQFILYNGQHPREMVKQVLAIKPDIILIDFHLGVSNEGRKVLGHGLVSSFRKYGYKGCLIGFSSDETVGPIFMKCGATGWVEKETGDVDKKVIAEIARIIAGQK